MSSFKINLNEKVLGDTTTDFVGIFFDFVSLYSLALNQLKEILKIIESHYTITNFSIFIKILSKNNEDLINLLNKEIQRIKGVLKTGTFIFLNQQINRQINI